MYGMLLFMLFTFTLLGIVINSELNQHSKLTNEQKESENNEDSLTDIEVGSDEVISEDDVDPALSEDEEPTLTEQDDANSLDTVMVFAGDIYWTDNILGKYNNDGIDSLLSKDMQEEFKEADIAMVNQEFAFSNRGTPMQDKQFTFRIDPKQVQIFNDMKVDIVTLANNHTLDYGTEALLDTFGTLDAANIQYVGAGSNLAEARKTKYIEVNDKTIAFLGASRVIPVTDWNAGSDRPGLFTTYDPTALISEIETAKELCDYVVVYTHWGIEKNTTPEEYQRTLAKQYIDAGADLVIGSHPHVLQGIEYYKDKPIVYSLGNFMFSDTINKTAVLKVTLNDNDGVQVQFLPCKAANGLTYKIDNQAEMSEFNRYMTELSYNVKFDENGIVQN